MALNTFFRGFSGLPKELRDKIWDFAVRDKYRAAYFFTISQHAKDDSPDDCILFGFNDWTYRRTLPSHWISAPKTYRAKGKAASWTTNNVSGYLHDSGLWTACKESRKALQRSWKHSAQDVVACPPLLQLDKTVRRSNIMTGCFVHDGGKRYFSIHSRDLVCFQPLSYDMFWFGSDMPFHIWGPNSVEHFAFEYDPMWGSLDIPEYGCWNEGGVLGCLARAYLCDTIHVWFIDYRLRRDTEFPKSTSIRVDRHVFYGTGCRFVEVRRDDPEWDTLGAVVDRSARRTVFDFLEDFGEAMGQYAFYENPQLEYED